jgi:hypothetical protein
MGPDNGVIVCKRKAHLMRAKTKPEQGKEVGLPTKKTNSESKKRKAHARSPVRHPYTIAANQADVPIQRVDSVAMATRVKARSPLPKQLRPSRDHEQAQNHTSDTNTVHHENTILCKDELQAHQSSSQSRQHKSKKEIRQEIAPASSTAATYSSDERDTGRSTKDRAVRTVGIEGKDMTNDTPMASFIRHPQINTPEWQNLVFGESGNAVELVVPGEYRNDSQVMFHDDKREMEEMEEGLVEG